MFLAADYLLHCLSVEMFGEELVLLAMKDEIEIYFLKGKNVFLRFLLQYTELQVDVNENSWHKISR